MTIRRMRLKMMRFLTVTGKGDMAIRNQTDEDEVEGDDEDDVDLQTVTGEGDLALQARVREPGEEEMGEGDNTASSA